MLSLPHVSMEAHGSAVTVYVHGHISDTDARRVITAFGTLPTRVRSLRLDLSAVDLRDSSTLDALLSVVEGWWTSRRGTTRVVPIIPPHCSADAASRWRAGRAR